MPKYYSQGTDCGSGVELKPAHLDTSPWVPESVLGKHRRKNLHLFLLDIPAKESCFKAAIMSAESERTAPVASCLFPNPLSGVWGLSVPWRYTEHVPSTPP
ncbi:hypothetical protein MCOR14_009399 [Pyricularia oryzae]|nr:hypothetical protein MCOR17_009810 [Pyricularia oryzae]KAI6480415.1 hypothetical protein MCOR13_011130 [Pyricularia oryzae]KAI6624040.1 hypothetical protein MCOR14_009399 [Pyricularia oryzae]